MDVDPAVTQHIAVHAEKFHYFCSVGCLSKFNADPELYLTGGAPLPDTVQEGTIWTCPMHPEIQKPGPGSCPICGMALEPLMPTADAGPNAEYHDMLRRFWIGLVLALPVLALEMGGHLTGLHQWLGRQSGNLSQMALATPVVLWAGWPFFERAWISLRTRSLNMFTHYRSRRHGTVVGQRDRQCAAAQACGDLNVLETPIYSRGCIACRHRPFLCAA